MPQRPGTKQLNAHLSEEAYENLRQFAAENGASMVSFLEALCLRLDAEKTPPPFLRDVVKEARRIEAERRRRRK